MKKLYSKNILLIIGLILSVLSFSILFFDKEFIYKYYVFDLWFLSIILILFNYVRFKSWDTKSLIKKNKKEIFIISGIFIFAFITRFIFLSEYPFSSIGDELRDGGWDAMRIANGDILNIFGYGRYDAHGLIIPTFNSLFYIIFGNSSLTFKVPSALLSVTNIILIYFLVRKYINKTTAIWASIIFICFPIDLYFARSETVVEFTTLIMSLILFSTFNFIKNFNTKSFAILGLVLGISLNFHASIKTVIYLTIIFVIGYSIYKLIKSNYKDLKRICFSILLFFVIVIAGFGPRLLFSPPDILLHTSRIPVVQDSSITIVNADKSNSILEPLLNYPKSLMVYFYEPTTGHFHGFAPLILFPAGIFFLLGIFYSMKSKNKYLLLLLFYALTIPFTNSAVTDIINSDHRITPLLSITAIFTGVGIIYCISLLKKENYYYLFYKSTICVIAAFIFIYPCISFFVNEPASVSMFRYDQNTYQDFMLTYLIKDIKSSGLKDSSSICINSSSMNNDYLNLLHIKEQFIFYLPNINIIYNVIPSSNYEVYASADCVKDVSENKWTMNDYCETYIKFVCPPDHQSFKIFIQS